MTLTDETKLCLTGSGGLGCGRSEAGGGCGIIRGVGVVNGCDT